MEHFLISRYDRHCLDKLLGTSTEIRLIEEGHIFTLSDGTEYDPGDTTGSIKTFQTPTVEPEEEPVP